MRRDWTVGKHSWENFRKGVFSLEGCCSLPGNATWVGRGFSGADGTLFHVSFFFFFFLNSEPDQTPTFPLLVFYDYPQYLVVIPTSNYYAIRIISPVVIINST